MSHRESGQIAPFITGCNPTTFGSAGTVSVQIDGTRFGTGMEVSCDSALGTVSNVVITHPTATSSRVVFDLSVSAPSGSVSRTITLSNAGISNGNSTQTVTHGFTPEDLVQSSSDGWFRPAGMRNASGQTPSNGDDVVEWLVNGTTSGLSKLYQSTASDRPVYTTTHAGWIGSTNHPGITKASGGARSMIGSSTLDGTWTRTSSDDYTIAAVFSPTSDATSWARAILRWDSTGGIGQSSGTYEDYFHLAGGAYHVSSSQNALVSRVRGNSNTYDQTYNAPLPLAGTVRVVLRKSGTSASLFYNSSTAVQTYTSPNNVSASALGGLLYIDEAVVSEALFLKYAATDSQISDLLNHWGSEYGA